MKNLITAISLVHPRKGLRFTSWSEDQGIQHFGKIASDPDRSLAKRDVYHIAPFQTPTRRLGVSARQ